MVCKIQKLSRNRSLLEFILCISTSSFLLIYNHIFSITFKSGDCAGQLIFFRCVLATYSLVEQALCMQDKCAYAWRKRGEGWKPDLVKGRTYRSQCHGMGMHLLQRHSNTYISILEDNIWPVIVGHFPGKY
jgi:hypothetical protein